MEEAKTLVSFNEELNDAMQQIGVKGEIKIAEWIRGSSATWTQGYKKNLFHLEITKTIV